MKSYTDLEQGKKLAEILPRESADTIYSPLGDNMHPWVWTDTFIEKDTVLCWSLAALLDVLDYPQLSKDKIGRGKVGWMVSVYPNDCRYDSCWHDNPVDACVEMIIKLHELKML